MASSGSVHYDIRLVLQARLQALTQIGDILSTSYVLREKPRAEESDPLPLVCICPWGKPKWKPLGFEKAVNWCYGVEVALIVGNNLDFTSRQDEYQAWFAKIADMVSAEFLNEVPSVWRTRIDDTTVFDREKLDQMYAVQSVMLKFDSQEPRQ